MTKTITHMGDGFFIYLLSEYIKKLRQRLYHLGKAVNGLVQRFKVNAVYLFQRFLKPCLTAGHESIHIVNHFYKLNFCKLSTHLFKVCKYRLRLSQKSMSFCGKALKLGCKPCYKHYKNQKA